MPKEESTERCKKLHPSSGSLQNLLLKHRNHRKHFPSETKTRHDEFNFDVLKAVEMFYSANLVNNIHSDFIREF